MNRTDLVRRVAGETGPGAAEADAAVKAVPESVAEALARDGAVRIVGFGTFAAKKRPARSRRPALSRERRPADPEDGDGEPPAGPDRAWSASRRSDGWPAGRSKRSRWIQCLAVRRGRPGPPRPAQGPRVMGQVWACMRVWACAEVRLAEFPATWIASFTNTLKEGGSCSSRI